MAERSRKSPVVPPEVRELIEESQKIQGWVERLAEHADEARPEVYRRVLSDYEGRLEKVTGRLVKHRADLVSNLGEHEARVASLEEDRDSHAAELEEARLRHAVGEYSEDDWESRRSGIEESIADLDERLAVEADAVDELTSIISSIGEGGAPAGEKLTAAADAAPAPAPNTKSSPPGRETSEVKRKDDAGTVPTAETGEPARARGAGKEPAAEAAEPTRTAAGESTGREATAKEPAATQEGAEAKGAPTEKERTPKEEADDESSAEYLDELEFLESLSLDEAERFDAVSAMLDDDEAGNGKKES